ncbi:hypothetical protein QBC36DRAFT_368481 [Triangularia setosa]|uniref:Uncharacterized protein n=1 Tax=Triangularia setosa TaxID=2587417 RepID=A0AAN6VZL4_9PEZI|nr:hypothetical protein QBC36DRAFT_368481 [Podospora setosa]
MLIVYTLEWTYSIASAANFNAADAILLLYKHGADVNKADLGAETPLLDSIMTNAYAAQPVPLRLGASHLAVARSGRNLLHFAAPFGYEKTLENPAISKFTGLDIAVRDSDGKTALKLFEEREPVSDELRQAFQRFLGSLDSVSQADWASREEGTDNEDQEFLDAVEVIKS